jgi:putative glutathione S-transferase
LVNKRIYEYLNNGVFRAGFAIRQESYEIAVDEVFETLDGLETRLYNRIYLVSDGLTEADIRLFPTLARFDAIYFGHFICNWRAEGLPSPIGLHAPACSTSQNPPSLARKNGEP